MHPKLKKLIDWLDALIAESEKEKRASPPPRPITSRCPLCGEPRVPDLMLIEYCPRCGY